MTKSCLILKDPDVVIGPGDEIWRLARSYHKSGDGRVLVLNVADDYMEPEHNRDICYIHSGLNDGPEDRSAPWGADNSIDSYVNAVLAFGHGLSLYRRTHLHCHSGVSRSCFVLALSLASYSTIETVCEAVEWIGAHYSRCDIHPKHFAMADAVIAELMRYDLSDYCSAFTGVL